MTDDFVAPAHAPRSYSAFWPLVIVLAAFAFSYLYQVAALISHRSAVNAQYAQAAQSRLRAQEIHDRLVALLSDLSATAPQDPTAAAILREAQQAGIIRERAGAPAATNAAPANP